MKLEIGSYIFQTYLPSILIVILSWASFWIDHEAVPARISVGLLTVLTITTQLSGSRAQLPRVPYIKVSKSWCADPRLLRFSWCSVHACFLGVKNEWYSSPFSSSSSLSSSSSSPVSSSFSSQPSFSSSLSSSCFSYFLTTSYFSISFFSSTSFSFSSPSLLSSSFSFSSSFLVPSEQLIDRPTSRSVTPHIKVSDTIHQGQRSVVIFPTRISVC